MKNAFKVFTATIDDIYSTVKEYENNETDLTLLRSELETQISLLSKCREYAQRHDDEGMMESIAIYVTRTYEIMVAISMQLIKIEDVDIIKD